MLALAGGALGVLSVAALMPWFAGPQAPSEPPPQPERTYEFRVTGSVDEALITWSGLRDGRRTRPAAPLPWARTLVTPPDRPPPLMTVNALTSGPVRGSITCTIVRDGIVVDEKTGSGERPFAACVGL